MSGGRVDRVWAPYMDWAKRHPRPRFDLCGSNLIPCTLDELPGVEAVLQPSGDNDHGYAPLIERIADHYGTRVDRVASASGASGANFLVFAALLGPGDQVVIERPAYDPLLGAARLLGAEVRRFDRAFEEGFDVDPDRIGAAVTPKTKLVVLTSPHNPSGATVGAGAATGTFAALADMAERRGFYVLVDEVYLDTASPRPEPAANRADAFISTNSLTKSYGLPGLRVGWVLAAPRVAEAVRRVRGTVEAIGAYPGEVMGQAAFERIDALARRARAILRPNLATLRQFIESRAELEWVRPAAGTVAFPRLTDGGDTQRFVELLLADFETAVVPGSFFEAPRHFRVAFGGPAGTLEGGLERIGRALDAR